MLALFRPSVAEAVKNERRLYGEDEDHLLASVMHYGDPDDMVKVSMYLDVMGEGTCVAVGSRITERAERVIGKRWDVPPLEDQFNLSSSDLVAAERELANVIKSEGIVNSKAIREAVFIAIYSRNSGLLNMANRYLEKQYSYTLEKYIVSREKERDRLAELARIARQKLTNINLRGGPILIPAKAISTQGRSEENGGDNSDTGGLGHSLDMLDELMAKENDQEKAAERAEQEDEGMEGLDELLDWLEDEIIDDKVDTPVATEPDNKRNGDGPSGSQSENNTMRTRIPGKNGSSASDAHSGIILPESTGNQGEISPAETRELLEQVNKVTGYGWSSEVTDIKGNLPQELVNRAIGYLKENKDNPEVDQATEKQMLLVCLAARNYQSHTLVRDYLELIRLRESLDELEDLIPA
jgi:hypothetical protein